MTGETLAHIDGDLHAANVDLKAFTDEYYRAVVGARLRPVLDTIRRMCADGGLGGSDHLAHPRAQRR